MENENFNLVFGKKVRELRLSNNWSQANVAVKLNISIPAVSKIETGVTDSNMTRVMEIADLFNVTVNDLLVGLANKAFHFPNLVPELTALKMKLSQKEQDIIKIQKKLIDLYEELEHLNLQNSGITR